MRWELLIPKSSTLFDCRGCYLRDRQPYLGLAEWFDIFLMGLVCE